MGKKIGNPRFSTHVDFLNFCLKIWSYCYKDSDPDNSLIFNPEIRFEENTFGSTTSTIKLFFLPIRGEIMK